MNRQSKSVGGDGIDIPEVSGSCSTGIYFLAYRSQVRKRDERRGGFLTNYGYRFGGRDINSGFSCGLEVSISEGKGWVVNLSKLNFWRYGCSSMEREAKTSLGGIIWNCPSAGK